MFGKKTCNNCKEKISEKHNFCPNCGSSFTKKSNKDSGMLGEDDFMDNRNNFAGPNIFGGIGGKMIGKMFENAMRVLEKEMEKEIKRKGQKQDVKTNFQLFINGKKINNLENSTNQKLKQKKEINQLPKNILKSFSDLPQKNPKTDVRRLSDKVIYEINMPGVKSLKDISITKLENNIEIKAISKDKAYQKMLPVDFPITDYNLSRGKLVLEFGVN
tara:strand:- start:3716 stop:4363 length:648 start_codon:yes stop_codon:yes gene_type:complete